MIKELIKQHLDGSQDSSELLFKELYKIAKKGVASTYFRYGKKNMKYDDDIQDVMIKVFNNLHKFDDAFPISTWIFKISNNTVIDKLRLKKNKTISLNQPINESGYELEIVDGSQDIYKNIENREKHEFFLKLINIDSLNTFEKQVLRLRFIEEMSYEEMSNETNKPVGTIKARVSSAKKKMFKYLNIESYEIRKKKVIV